MTFIAGICSPQSGALELDLLERMCASQLLLAPGGIGYYSLWGAKFARGLPVGAEEPACDAPIPGDLNMLTIADARIDNREQLLRVLGLPAGSALSDNELVCRLFRLEGDRALDRISGDFALASWCCETRTLTLARDITGQRPLHYSSNREITAFASMPHGLFAVSPPTINRQQIARFVADIPRVGPETYFEDIRRVEPGCVVHINGGGAVNRRYWRPDLRAKTRPDRDYVTKLRDHLSRATSRRLRGAGSRVGAHLSAGLDSGGVAASAALEMKRRSGSVIAFTSAPREGFAGPLPRGRIADESALAASVAALHENMEHQIIRAEEVSPLDVIRRDSGLFGEPLGLPCNQVWWASIADASQAAGVKVLLTGEAGNYGFSSGGVEALHEYLRNGWLVRAIREAYSLHRQGLTWRGIAYAALAPWIPGHLWLVIQKIHWGSATTSEGAVLLSSQSRALLPADLLGSARSSQPDGGRGWRIDRMSQADPGVFRKGMLARWGIDERDPTSDRDLIEYCISLPADQLLLGGVTRRAARCALEDRLPAGVLDGPRGYQGADWYERLSGDDVLRIISEVEGSQAVREIFDISAMARLAADWPSAGWAEGTTISRFRYGLLRAVAAAEFVRGFEAGAGPSALRA